MQRINGIRKKIGMYEWLCILLLYMPFHYYICECLFSETKIDNMIRDVVIVIMFVIILYKSKLKIGRHDMFVVMNCIIITIFAVCSFIKNGYPATFNILRTYIIPQLIFIVCSRLKITYEQYRNLNNIIVVELALIAIYGVFQAFILGDKFLINMGYPSNGYSLSGYSYYISGFFGNQRSVGTFISPNICGVLLIIAICVYSYSNVICIKRKKIVIFCLGIGLIATFSRSAIIGLLLSIMVITLISGNKVKVTKRILTIGITSVIFAIIIIIYVDSHYFGGVFFDMIIRSLTSVFNKSDPSAKAHVSDLLEPISKILNHPLGLGFGNNGPMALDVSDSANIVESSFYLMIYELGIVLGMLFFVPYFCVIIDTFRNKKYRNYLPAAISIAVCFTYVLLPNVQTYEILFYSFMYMGFYYNPYIKKIYIRQ